jgi:hypothetical protein
MGLDFDKDSKKALSTLVLSSLMIHFSLSPSGE